MRSEVSSDYRHAPGDQGGFTLLEVLVSLMLVGVIAAAVAPLVLVGRSTAAMAEEATELTAGANDRIERLMAEPFESTALEAGGSITASIDGYSVDPLPGFPDRYARWEIADESAILKRIRLVVGSRRAFVGPAREVVLETFKVDFE